MYTYFIKLIPNPKIAFFRPNMDKRPARYAIR